MEVKERNKETTPDLLIVVPCYNEEKRLPITDFISFLNENKNVSICFVNDGSSDATLDILNDLKIKYQNNIHIISNSRNLGKAESVRNGVLYGCETQKFDVIAYLDADLATSLQECSMMANYLNNGISFCFGSRIMKIGSVIERSFFRHITGRVIATFISNILSLKVYDTQCGCKLIKRELALQIFKDRFISEWLFDVELFARIINLYGIENCTRYMIEVPLLRWQEKGGSKIKFNYAFRVWFDLYKIKHKYSLK